MDDKKVFIAEIGNQYTHRNMGSSIFASGTPPETILVVAADYNQAVTKVELYLENMPEEERENIFDGEGNIKKNLDKSACIQLLSLKVTDTKIIY